MQRHVVEVAALTEREEIPRRTRRDIAMQLDIEVAMSRLQLRVALLANLLDKSTKY